MGLNHKIIFSQRIDHILDRGETRDAIDQRLVSWVDHLGATPIPVPNNLNPKKSLIDWLNIISPNAVILSGGNDLGQFPIRDNTETCILNFTNSS